MSPDRASVPSTDGLIKGAGSVKQEVPCSVTADVFHDPMGWLNFAASVEHARSCFRTLPVFQELIG